MIRFAFRAAPWPLLLFGCGAVAGLMICVALRPDVMWPLQGTSVGLLAGLVAFAMDERCAAIVDTLPRPLWWRTAGRGLVVVPVTAALWAVSLDWAGARLPGHRGVFLLQGAAAIVGALAVTACQRANGAAEPGTAFASAAIPVAAMLALARPWEHVLPVFPAWPYEDWSRTRVIWLAVLLAGVVVLASTFAREARGRPAVSRRPPGPVQPAAPRRPA